MTAVAESCDGCFFRKFRSRGAPGLSPACWPLPISLPPQPQEGRSTWTSAPSAPALPSVLRVTGLPQSTGGVGPSLRPAPPPPHPGPPPPVALVGGSQGRTPSPEPTPPPVPASRASVPTPGPWGSHSSSAGTAGFLQFSSDSIYPESESAGQGSAHAHHRSTSSSALVADRLCQEFPRPQPELRSLASAGPQNTGPQSTD